MSLIEVSCAVCSGRDFKLLYPGALDPNRDASFYFSSSRQSAAYPDIVRCKACGMVMANPRDDEQTLARVYGELSDQAYEDEDESRASAADEHLKLVLAERKTPARLLDLGCASGFFVASAVRAGYDVTGADASHWMIERARSRCSQARLVVGTLESLSFQAEFDVITLWDVLEHVHSPREVIHRLSGWLKPGGLLLMSMPNAASLTARVLGSRWVLLLREHLWYFSPSTISPLLEQCGFELAGTKTKWVSFSLANVAGRLTQYGGALSALRDASVSPLLKRMSLRFPIGEMNVVARKR